MRLFLPIITICFFLTGCGSLLNNDFGLDPVEQESKLRAGEVNVTMFEPIPWYTVADQLKPKFNKKSANEVIGEVAPITGSDDFRGSRRTAVQFQGQIGGSVINNSTTETENIVTDNDGNVTQLNAAGQPVAGAVTMERVRNAATFTALGSVFEIELDMTTVPAGTSVTVRVDAIGGNDQVLNETANLTFEQPAAK